MLEPGGYRQRKELSGSHHCVVTFGSSVDTSAFQEMHKIMDGHGRFEPTLRIPSSLSANGFEDSKIYHDEDSIDLAKAHNDVFLVTPEGFVVGIAKSRGEEEAGKMQQLIQRIYSSSLEGAAMFVPKLVGVGRKKYDHAEAL